MWEVYLAEHVDHGFLKFIYELYPCPDVQFFVVDTIYEQAVFDNGCDAHDPYLFCNIFEIWR